MFESKYSRYVTDNTTRFAEDDEIIENLSSFDSGCGIPLFQKDSKIYVDNLDNHSITIGGTGCGKSRAVAKTLVTSIIKHHESAIVNDPKGELYKSTAHYAKENGYNLKVINLRDPEKSDKWNPLHLIYHYYKENQISKSEQAMADFSISLMSDTINPDDRYWDVVASNKFCSDIGLCLHLSELEDIFTIQNILPFCNESAERTIENIMSMCKELPQSVVSGEEAVINLSAERTKSCIYSVIHSGIDELARNDSVIRLFNDNDIDFYELGTMPTIIYVIYPDEKASMNKIVKTFLTQSYIALLDICDESDDNKLPIRVNYVLDEFSNLTQIESFDNRISEARSKNIRYHLFIQSMDQLKGKYGDCTANTILSNCTSWICFSSKEIEFLNTISKLCGTIIDYNGIDKPLMSASEMQYLNKSNEFVEVLILRQGVRPYVCSLPYFDYLFPDNRTSNLSPKKDFFRKDDISSIKLSPRDWERIARNRDIL